VLVGDASVGKTALLNRYINDKEPANDSTSTIGVEFSKRTLTVDEKLV
jgi:GTPase SAR1 family protein